VVVDRQLQVIVQVRLHRNNQNSLHVIAQNTTISWSVSRVTVGQSVRQVHLQHNNGLRHINYHIQQAFLVITVIAVSQNDGL